MVGDTGLEPVSVGFVREQVLCERGGRYWTRTSDLTDVNRAL